MAGGEDMKLDLCDRTRLQSFMDRWRGMAWTRDALLAPVNPRDAKRAYRGREIGPAATARLLEMLDQWDEWVREGAAVLTLATNPEAPW
jgi:hypothetical protein